MAKTNKYLGPLSMAGMKVGGIRFYEKNGKVYTRSSYTNHSKKGCFGDRMMVRLRFGSVRPLWRAFKDKLENNFEGLEPGRSGYTTFMRLNGCNGVFLTKKQLGEHFQIVTPLHISEGTLEPISQTINEDCQLVTNIAIGDFEITGETTIGDFARHISLEFWNNETFTFVAALQTTDGMGVPRCEVETVDIPIDASDNRPLLALTGKLTLVNKDGFLATQENLPQGCFAFYRWRNEDRKVQASSQMLVSNNDELIEKFISEEQFEEAGKSYGKKPEPFLSPWKFEKPTFE